jgi:hypothetical protein
VQNSFLLKANKLSTKKRDSKTNLRDALIAEEQESNREEEPVVAAASAAAETETAAEKALVAETDGRINWECLNAFPLLFCLFRGKHTKRLVYG